MGNGVRTSLWNDDWIGNDPLKDVLPDIFNLALHLKIIVAEGWNLSFRRLLNDRENSRLDNFFKLLGNFRGTIEQGDRLVGG